MYDTNFYKPSVFYRALEIIWNMGKVGRGISVIGFVFLLVLVISCEKGFVTSPLSVTDADNIGQSSFLLPINFGEYNLSAVTKSSQGSDYNFNYSPELLDWAQSKSSGL